MLAVTETGGWSRWEFEWPNHSGGVFAFHRASSVFFPRTVALAILYPPYLLLFGATSKRASVPWESLEKNKYPNRTTRRASSQCVCVSLSYPLACHCQCHACHPSVGRIGPLEIVVLREVPQLLLDLRPPVCVNAVIAPPWRRVSYALETAMRAPPGGLLVVPTNPDAKRVPQSRQVAVGFAALGTANLQFRNHRRSTATECHEY